MGSLPPEGRCFRVRQLRKERGVAAQRHGADWKDFESEAAAIDEGVRAGQCVVRPFVYQALSHSPADLQACSRIFAASL